MQLTLFRTFSRLFFWVLAVIVLSILFPALIPNYELAYLRPWALYSNSVFQWAYENMQRSSPSSLILLMDLSLSSIAAVLVVANNRNMDNSLNHHRPPHGELSHPAYLRYTVDNFNRSIDTVFDEKRQHVVDLLGFSFLMGTLFSGAPAVTTGIEFVAHSLKYSWLIGTPHLILQNIGYLSFGKDDFLINEQNITKNAAQLKNKHVIFILPTKGGNHVTVKMSVESAIFWKEIIELKHGKMADISQWIICEQDDYEANVKGYGELATMGARVIIVPREFNTVNGTRYKARALVYANKVMAEEGLVNKDTWIYHQDDETKVGEDTILGIMDYIINAGDHDIYAAGIINYADSLTYTPSRAQEPSRSYDDFRILLTTKTNGKLSFGHHGSHLLVRADVEAAVGWDFGDVKTEDWMFGLMMWQRHRPGKTILKGYGYEKPPLTTKDLLKQRRRWAHGAMQIVFDKRIRPRYRLAALYGVVSWMSALPSLIAFAVSIIYPTGGLFPASGIIAGFTWYSLYRYHAGGYKLNDAYLTGPEKRGHRRRYRIIFAVIGGMMLEACAPWYALINPPKGFEVIKKDD